MKHWIWILIIVIFLGACQTAQDVTPVPLTATEEAATVTATAAPSATATPAPPTATPTDPPPTQTPTDIPPTPTPDPFANYPVEGYGPVSFPENINPLTGLDVDDPEILDRRPVAVKISNFPREIRPQWGLSSADQVFEYYQEAGQTRFHAIYYGTDVDMAGPIRSARFPDEHLVRAYKSVFSFASADYRVRWVLFNSDFGTRLATVSDKPCPPDVQYPNCRTDPEFHLATDSSILTQHFTEKGIENGRQYLDGLLFNKFTPEGGESGESVIVRYSADSYHKWSYDPSTGSYLRYQDAATDTGDGESYELMLDKNNNQPVAAENVVVLLAPYSYYSRQPEMIKINLIGFGKAFVFRDGQVFQVNWARVNQNEIISLTYDDGSRFPLRPGNTWFDIIGQTSPILESAPDWRFQFQTP